MKLVCQQSIERKFRQVHMGNGERTGLLVLLYYFETRMEGEIFASLCEETSIVWTAFAKKKRARTDRDAATVRVDGPSFSNVVGRVRM